MPTSLPDAATWFAEQGWGVFPLNGKRPRISKANGGRGFGDATADPATVRAWWRRWPSANIGWDLTIAGRGNVVVDDDGGAAAELAATDRPLPATLTASTRSRSRRHFYYRANGLCLTGQPDVPLLQSSAQTRVAGFGYVLLPPSVHPETGATYAFESDPSFIADAPGWLETLITRAIQAEAPRVAMDNRELTDDDRLVLDLALELDPILRRLWEGRWQETGRYASQSQADYAFMSRFLNLGVDPGQVQRLLRASALYRAKTDSKRPGGTYLTTSLARLVASKSDANAR